jgi:hypothetical protein
LRAQGFSAGARTFLGNTVNTLERGAYFGERALLASEVGSIEDR